MKARVIACCTGVGFQMKRRTTYAELKAAVLEAGRFSVFEATETPKAARFYTRLCKDPDIETFKLGFPWTGVRQPQPPTPTRGEHE